MKKEVNHLKLQLIACCTFKFLFHEVLRFSSFFLYSIEHSTFQSCCSSMHFCNFFFHYVKVTSEENFRSQNLQNFYTLHCKNYFKVLDRTDLANSTSRKELNYKGRGRNFIRFLKRIHSTERVIMVFFRFLSKALSFEAPLAFVSFEKKVTWSFEKFSS